MKKLVRYYSLAAISILGLASLALAQTATTTTPTPTPAPAPMPAQLFKPQELNINPSGRFLAHGMIVESVSGNSFVGKVWGTSWTVNIINASELKFLLRNGAGTGQTTLSGILKPGDEVGISGYIDESRELTVNGQVVRDYSVGDIQEFRGRETENENGNENENENEQERGNRHENKNRNEEEGGANNSESSVNQQAIQQIQQQIQSILEQIKVIQGR